MSRTLLQGPSEDELYPIRFPPQPPNNFHKVTAFLGVKTTFPIWHNWLGDPTMHLVQQMLKQHNLPVLGQLPTILHLYKSCQLAKSKQLPFADLCRVPKAPLKSIHTDVWTYHVLSISGCKYYVSFIDEFSRFTWLFPLHFKSNVFACFVKFKTIVEHQFSCKIKTIQSDGGGEYSKTQFQDYLTSHGILSHISCPHTPQQNGISERKHRHIVETSLALLAQSNLHTKYWIDAFNTTVYLINRLPTPVLCNVSPYATLLHVEPNYSFLKVFGFSCFPLFRPYNAHKLLFQSKKCIFMGYSANHLVYRCSNPITNRVYISRNVVFDETSFPTQDLVSPSSTQVRASPGSVSSFLQHLGYCVKTNSCASTSSPPPPCSPPTATMSMDLNMTLPSPPFVQESMSPPSSPMATTSSVTQSQVDESPSSSNALPVLALVPVSNPIDVPTDASSSSITLPPTQMVTRSQTGHLHPRHFPEYQLYYSSKHPLKSFSAITVPPKPTCFSQAVELHDWQAAMGTKFDALFANQTWTLCPRPLHKNVIRNK